MNWLFRIVFKDPNAVVAIRANNNQPISLSRALTIIAAAHIIDCEIMIFDISFPLDLMCKMLYIGATKSKVSHLERSLLSPV